MTTSSDDGITQCDNALRLPFGNWSQVKGALNTSSPARFSPDTMHSDEEPKTRNDSIFSSHVGTGVETQKTNSVARSIE